MALRSPDKISDDKINIFTQPLCPLMIYMAIHKKSIPNRFIMMDYHKKGYAYIQLFDPQIALDAWDEIDQQEIHQVVGLRNKPWQVLIPPFTPKFRAFARELEQVSCSFSLMLRYIYLRAENATVLRSIWPKIHEPEED